MKRITELDDAILLGKLRIAITGYRKLVIYNEETKQKTKPIKIQDYALKEFCNQVHDALSGLGWKLSPSFSRKLYRFLFTFYKKNLPISAMLVCRFCPKCKKYRNMMLWADGGASHYTARCVHCGHEWVFDSEDDTLVLYLKGGQQAMKKCFFLSKNKLCTVKRAYDICPNQARHCSFFINNRPELFIADFRVILQQLLKNKIEIPLLFKELALTYFRDE